MDETFALDSKHLKTFRRLLTEPGAVGRDYIEGRRVGIMSPLRYYLLVVGLNVASTGMLRLFLRSPSAHQTSESGFFDSSFVALQIGLAFMAVLVPTALGLRLVYEQRNLWTIEHYTFLLYAAAQGLLFTLGSEIAWTLITRRPFPGDADGIVWLVTLTAVLVQGGRHLYAERGWKVLGKVLAAYAITVASAGVIGMFAFTVAALL